MKNSLPTFPAVLCTGLCYSTISGFLWAVGFVIFGGNLFISASTAITYLIVGMLMVLLLALKHVRDGKTRSIWQQGVFIGALACVFAAVVVLQMILAGASVPLTAVLWLLISCILLLVMAYKVFRPFSLLHKEEMPQITAYTVRTVGFCVFLLIVVFPFYFLLVSSVTPRAMLLQNPTQLVIPLRNGMRKLFTGYAEVLTTFKFGRYILNSTLVALGTVLLTLIPSILGAYAVTRLRFRGRRLLSSSILLIYMFPAIVLVIPLYSIFTSLGLRNSLLGLLIVYPAMTIPVALYMLRGYFQTLPRDIEEAGIIDGCSRLGVIWRITLPLSMPALASVGLYVFMIAWNEFLFAFMFLDDPAIYTLSRGVVSLNSQEVPRQFLMSGAVVITVPIMALFFFFERFLVGGLAAGGVKG